MGKVDWALYYLKHVSIISSALKQGSCMIGSKFRREDAYSEHFSGNKVQSCIDQLTAGGGVDGESYLDDWAFLAVSWKSDS